ncbi:TonB-dependent receptor [Roseiterribacter gracilis]|uniref:TonB-dependent receptor n=1 Tax=Roseiterribacter gracilis TaxID=2812848 RepID=A0A8S8XGJ5_9PROT|nr:TonB-dependent receptor [Rhodospirillales bacterium TMPK1]
MRTLRSTTSLSTWLLAGMVAATAAGTAQAQIADGVPAGALTEVVVTAQKREQRLQEVPQAVQVVTGAQLEAAGVREFTDLTKMAPSLVVRPAENPVNASVSIRGVGTFAFSIGVEPSVAVQMDDVPVQFQPRAFTDLSDVERIEVLRGPQSTLYGKSASAGLINIVTKDPTTTFSSKVNAMYTTDHEYLIGAAVSGPISDKFGFRVNVTRDQFDGNVKNLYNGNKVNGRDFTAARGKFRWDVTDALTVTAGLWYVDGGTTVGRPFIGLAPNAFLRGNSAQPPTVYAPGVTAGPDNTNITNNFLAGTNYTDQGQSLKIEWNLGFASLVSITGHDHYKLTDTLDQDDTSVATPDNRQFGTFKQTSWSQEVRLVSANDSPIRYTAGFYYANVDFSRDFTRGPFFAQARWYGTSGSEQIAGFGQLEYTFFDKFTAIGGVRVQHEKIDYTFRDIQNGNAFFSGGGTDDFETYKLALQYQVAKDFMVYGSYSTGHKGQTFDLSTGFNSNRALAGPVKPETSKSWEIGARTQWLNRRVTANLTLFDARYEDFQAQGIETLPDGTLNYRLTNVGKLHNRGVELETSALVTEQFRAGFSAAYLDAEIADFPLAQCFPLQTAAQGCTGSPARQNLTGATPPQSPKWKLTATADYTIPLPSMPFEGVLQGVYSYQTTVNYGLNQDPQTVQKSYGILNLSAGIRDTSGRYEVSVFVNNVTDQRYYAHIFNSTGNYNNVLATQSLPPRDFSRYAGIKASYNF